MAEYQGTKCIIPKNWGSYPPLGWGRLALWDQYLSFLWYSQLYWGLLKKQFSMIMWPRNFIDLLRKKHFLGANFKLSFKFISPLHYCRPWHHCPKCSPFTMFHPWPLLCRKDTSADSVNIPMNNNLNNLHLSIALLHFLNHFLKYVNHASEKLLLRSLSWATAGTEACLGVWWDSPWAGTEERRFADGGLG